MVFLWFSRVKILHTAPLKSDFSVHLLAASYNVLLKVKITSLLFSVSFNIKVFTADS